MPDYKFSFSVVDDDVFNDFVLFDLRLRRRAMRFKGVTEMKTSHIIKINKRNLALSASYADENLEVIKSVMQ